MTARLHDIQTTLVAGEIDPDARQKIDIEEYYQGAANMTNVVPLLQAVGTRRPGTEFIEIMRHEIEAVDLVGATLDAPNGGTAGNATDGDIGTSLVTTTDIAAINPYVVLHLDLTAPVIVDFVDLVDVFLSAGILDDEFRVQYSTDDAAWFDFGDPVNLDATTRTRRRSAGAATPVTARYWRFVRIGSTVLAATVSLAEIRFYVETAVNGEVKKISFTFSDQAKYEMVMTDQNLAVFRNGLWVAAVPVPYLSVDIPFVNFTQAFDTLILFHKDYPPYRVFRQGSDDEWDARDQIFKNIPQFDFGDSPGGVNEVQQIKFVSFLAGETFNMFLDTQLTSSIAVGASIAATAANIQAALRALPNTSATGISCSGASDIVTITFAGDDGLTNWPEVIPAILVTASGVMITSTVTEGEQQGEDIMSVTRGWPRAGTFFKSRLWYGGFRSLEDFWGYSVNGDFFDLDNRTTGADRGIIVTAVMDQSVVIYHMFAGPVLQIFTSAGEFYVPSAKGVPITPLTTAAELSSRRGVLPKVQPFESDGTTLFVQKGGNSLRQYDFNDFRDNYEGTNISVLASHLILDPTAAAIQRAQNKNEADLYYMVNGTSDMTVLLHALNPVSTAFGRWTTAGRFLAVSAEDAGDLYAVIERNINGVDVQYLERFSDDYYMDAGQIRAVAPDTTVLTDLEHLEGELIHFIIDGSPAGSAPVSGGSVTLPVAANSEVILGLNFVPLLETMPVVNQLPDGTSIGRKKRIIDIELGLVNTTNVEVSANGGPFVPVVFKNLGDNLLDVSLFNQAFTGIKRVTGLKGWVREASLIIRQSEPGKLTISSIKKVVAI